MKTEELIGPALDWAVALADDFELGMAKVRYPEQMRFFNAWQPTKYWDQGGVFIEREHIALWSEGYDWEAKRYGQHESWGPTPLIAAMRCFVASKLGADIDIPEELR